MKLNIYHKYQVRRVYCLSHPREGASWAVSQSVKHKEEPSHNSQVLLCCSIRNRKQNYYFADKWKTRTKLLFCGALCIRHATAGHRPAAQHFLGRVLSAAIIISDGWYVYYFYNPWPTRQNYYFSQWDKTLFRLRVTKLLTKFVWRKTIGLRQKREGDGGRYGL